MKSVKMFLGMMLCLVILAGQAQAVTLDMDGVTQTLLDSYKTDYGVEFLSWSVGDDELYKKFKIDSGTATINFDKPMTFESISYEITGSSPVTWQAEFSNSKPLSGSLDSTDVLFAPSWATSYLTSIVFTVGAKTTLFLQSVSVTPTPLPGAAILLGSGLLGLVGLRRREII